jgi:hypothetical protein
MATERTTLYIRRNSDGAIHKSHWQDGGEFWWTEGNGACDCNRAIAFGDVEDTTCGDSRYDLVHADGTPFIDWEPGS